MQSEWDADLFMWILMWGRGLLVLPVLLVSFVSCYTKFHLDSVNSRFSTDWWSLSDGDLAKIFFLAFLSSFFIVIVSYRYHIRLT